MLEWLRNKYYLYRCFLAVKLLGPSFPYLYMHIDSKDESIQAIIFASSEEILNKFIGD